MCRFWSSLHYRILNQQGQAAMLVLVFLGVILLCFILLYKSGMVTSAKMELQNGADAAAYSASTLEARALNFCAYTNRAMAANEVGIGQMVGMLSWVDEFQDVQPYEALYSDIPILDIIMDAVYSAIEGVGTPIHEVLEGIAPLYIKVLSETNKFYSVSQEAYYDATLALAASALFQNLNENVSQTDFKENLLTDLEQTTDENRSGARLSKFGLMALAAHATSYLTVFTKRYSPDKEKDLQGMGRLAATIREGRDGFSSGRRCGDHDSNRYKPECENRDWGLSIVADINLKLIKLGLKAGVTSYGGTELRFKKKGLTDEYKVVWSAVDSAVLGAKFYVKVPLFKKKTWEIPGLPFLGGQSQATGGLTFLTPADMLPPLFGQDEDMPDGPYGNAGDLEHLPAWVLGITEMEEKQVPDDPYPNLRAYRDIPVDDEDSSSGDTAISIPSAAPFFIVGVVRNMKNIDKKPVFSGSLAMDSGSSYGGKIAALAKSEVYFSRPDDLRYFKREDGRIEKPSLFSPFWQARLVKTSKIDRLLALALQQDILWIKGYNPGHAPSFTDLVHDFEKILENCSGHLPSFTGLVHDLEKIVEKLQ